MHRTRRDRQVADALKESGYELSAVGVSQAFTLMFRIATPIFIDARAEEKDLWDILPAVKKELDWGRLLPEAVFLELFTRLVEARWLWEQRPGFLLYSHSPLARTIAEFREMIRDCDSNSVSWILTHADIYNDLAHGMDEDNEGDVGAAGPDECDVCHRVKRRRYY
ncbi:hypothetical protein NUW58_g726 [Xylaria curta]|uniref:Uncharacterized protein n=1 Tax=Xylaria curta TaxID=42375 RepID=A0ACC1PN41_9PEZI|nr:hypothetical protein NUW58_g726 [Xylaria curta]